VDGGRGESRIAAARARLEQAKALLACAALAAFGISVFLVRGNHAAASSNASRSNSATVQQPASSTSDDYYYYGDDDWGSQSGSGFSPGTTAPSQSTAPPVTSGGS
jgi:hypothetical protein